MWGPPPAAKPGVIPLRPLGVGEILDGAVSTMRAHWRTVLGVSLVIAVVVEILLGLLDGFVFNDSSSAGVLRDASATPEEVSRAMGDSLLSSGIALAISMIGIVLASALLATVISSAVLGRPITTRRALRDARSQLPSMFGLLLLLMLVGVLVVVAGALPRIVMNLAGANDTPLGVLGALASCVLVVWLMVRFSLAFPALMLEKQGVRKAMSRSVKLVTGSWWRVFGIQLLAGLITFIVSMIIIVPFTLLANALDGNSLSSFVETGGADAGWTFLIVSGVGSVLSSTLTLPITAGVTVLLYIDQRIRREALDLALTRAAAGEAGTGAQEPQDLGNGSPVPGEPAPGTTPGS